MQKVALNFPSGKTAQLAFGHTLYQFAEDEEWQGRQVIAFFLNSQALSLHRPVLTGGLLQPIYADNAISPKAYLRSLNFLAQYSIKKLYPQVRFVIGQNIGDTYFYRCAENAAALPCGYTEKVAAHMREVAGQAIAVLYSFMSYSEAVDYFKRAGQAYTASLLEYSNEEHVGVYQLDGVYSLDCGVQLPNTAPLKNFELIDAENGFFLRYPTLGFELAPARKECPLLFSVYKEYQGWVGILGSACVGHINAQIQTRKGIQNLINMAEGLHEKKITAIADQITGGSEICFVFIAGPSSSGKTTFTKKLALQLRINGFEAVALSLDNFYNTPDMTPLDEEGRKDFEHIEALDLELLNTTLNSLLAGDEVELPRYVFKTQSRIFDGTKIAIGKKTVVLIEGLHALNERLSAVVPEANKFKIYISALTQLNLDEQHRLSTTDNRFIRRLVRDGQFRGASAAYTFRLWDSVQRGEERWVFPYQETADAAFNSSLDYELAVLKPYAEPLLKEIKADTPCYAQASRLLKYLGYFTAVSSEYVPSYSILREFIGNSGYKY